MATKITPSEIKAYYDEARSADYRYKERMKRNYELYRGRHWPKHTGKDGKYPDWMSDIVLPRIFTYVETALAILTDNLPIFDAKPVGRMDTRKSALMNENLRLWEIKARFRRFLSLIVKDLLIGGVGAGVPTWDEKKQNVRNLLMDPFKLFIDPDASAVSLDQAEYIIYREVRSKAYVEEHYPDKASLLEFSQEEFLGDKDLVTIDRGPIPLVPMGKFETKYEGDGSDRVSARKKQVVLYECWYDGGNRRGVTGEGKMLEDEEAEGIYGDELEDPFQVALFACYPQPHEPWPMGMPEALEKLQMQLNKGMADTINHSNATLNPRLIIPGNAEISDEQARENKPGGILRPKTAQAAAAIRWEYPPDLPAYTSERHHIVGDEMNRTAGLDRPAMGQKPQITQPSGRAILALQEASHTKLRLITRNIEDALTNYGEKVLAIMQSKYGAKHHRRLFDIHDELFAHKGNPIKKFSNALWKFWNASDPLGGKWDLKVDVESALPDSKLARAEQALDLFARGAIDRQELLERLEWPGREEVMRRIGNVVMPPAQPQGMPLAGAQPEGGIGPGEEAGMEGA